MKKVDQHLFQQNDEILNYLKESRLFGHLPEAVLKKMIPLSEMLQYSPKEIILSEGEKNDHVFFLIRGAVGVYASGEWILTLKRIGDIFGEMSVISDRKCTATVIAETHVSVFSLRARDVGQYTDLKSDEMQNLLYRIFSMILSEKLNLTTDKAKKYEAANRKLAMTLEKHRQEIEERKTLEEKMRNRNVQMENELRLAAEFQNTILPKMCNAKYLDMEAYYLPFHEVSGDIYDLSYNREGAVNIFLGDATGHGVTAAFMTMMVTIALNNIRKDLPTCDLMSQLNLLLASRETGKLMTGIYLRIDPEGQLTATQASHPYLIILPHSGSSRVLFKKQGAPLGRTFYEDIPYKEDHYQLEKGDKIFIYTDGVIEWENYKGTQFGYGRLIRFLEQHQNKPLEKIVSQLVDYLKAFSSGIEQPDDLTIIGLQYLG